MQVARDALIRCTVRIKPN